MGTLEPINPIDKTPYGAFVIHNDLVCTPTSLCTWKQEEKKNKPVVYCHLPQHTLNPVCQETNKGVGLLNCFEEPTCGGLVPLTTTKKILRENPHYIEVIHKEEIKEKTGRHISSNHRNNQQHKVIQYMLMTVICLLIIMFFLLIWFSDKQYYPLSRKKKHKHFLSKPRSV